MKLKIILIILAISLLPKISYCDDGFSEGGNVTSQPVTLPNPLGDKTGSPQELIGQIISAVLGITGSLALVMFIYGGFTWMLSSGNSDKVTKGKNTLVWASIGLVVIFSSYALVRFVLQGITGAT
jgi:hypothetical protein